MTLILNFIYTRCASQVMEKCTILSSSLLTTSRLVPVVFRIGDVPDEGNVAQNNSDVPLSLHTLPAAKTIIVEPVQVPQAQDAPKDTRPDAKERGISISTSTIPRLISVVEIIKREYLKTLKVTHSRVLSGLYQYNEIGYLERHELQQTMPSEEDRTRALAMALEGKQ
jgi:hypothetical protein